MLNFRGESGQGDVKILKEFEKEPSIEHTMPTKRDIRKREAVKLRRRSRIKVTFPDLSDI